MDSLENQFLGECRYREDIITHIRQRVLAGECCTCLEENCLEYFVVLCCKQSHCARCYAMWTKCPTCRTLKKRLQAVPFTSQPIHAKRDVCISVLNEAFERCARENIAVKILVYTANSKEFQQYASAYLKTRGDGSYLQTLGGSFSANCKSLKHFECDPSCKLLLCNTYDTTRLPRSRGVRGAGFRFSDSLFTKIKVRRV